MLGDFYSLCCSPPCAPPKGPGAASLLRGFGGAAPDRALYLKSSHISSLSPAKRHERRRPWGVAEPPMGPQGRPWGCTGIRGAAHCAPGAATGIRGAATGMRGAARGVHGIARRAPGAQHGACKAVHEVCEAARRVCGAAHGARKAAHGVCGAADLVRGAAQEAGKSVHEVRVAGSNRARMRRVSPIVRRMWDNSCRANQGSHFLARCLSNQQRYLQPSLLTSRHRA